MATSAMAILRMLQEASTTSEELHDRITSTIWLGMMGFQGARVASAVVVLDEQCWAVASAARVPLTHRCPYLP
jgi:hypothetical protein